MFNSIQYTVKQILKYYMICYMSEWFTTKSIISASLFHSNELML